MSPKQTPRISENADFGPPEIVRATIAIHTGPGVINKIIKAIIYRNSCVVVMVKNIFNLF